VWCIFVPSTWGTDFFFFLKIADMTSKDCIIIMFVHFMSLLHKILKMNRVEISHLSDVSSLKLVNVFVWNPVSGFHTENYVINLWSYVLVSYHLYLTQSPSWTLAGTWVTAYCAENMNVDIWIYTFNFIIIYWILQLPWKPVCSEICHPVILFAERFVPLFFVLFSLGKMSGFVKRRIN
jgi:hypothetical protein